jgi:hypothetical protein
MPALSDSLTHLKMPTGSLREWSSRWRGADSERLVARYQKATRVEKTAILNELAELNEATSCGSAAAL